MMKIINAFPGVVEPMTEEETKNFMANNNNNLLIHLGIIDEKGKLNVIPLGCYFDNDLMTSNIRSHSPSDFKTLLYSISPIIALKYYKESAIIEMKLEL